jgi:dipeptidyl aminopeptidase/acylaminoacyl peptidase
LKTFRAGRSFHCFAIFAVFSATAACGRPYALQNEPAAAQAAFAGAELFKYDATQPLAAEEAISETRDDYQVHKLSYASANNQRVPAFFILPTRPASGKAPCIVLMHGLGQDKKALAMLWGTFAKSGYAVLAIDALHHGERAPKAPLELFGANIDATRELLVQTVIDLRRGLDFLQGRKEIDPKRIGYLGFSMGGILGTLLSAVDDRVNAPVIALAGGNWKLMAQTSTLAQAVKARQSQGVDGIGWQPLDPMDPVRFVGRISPRPVLFINGDNDTVVPVACAKELHQAAGPGKEVLFYKGGHVPAGVEFIRVVGKITQWMDAHLKKG